MECIDLDSSTSDESFVNKEIHDKPKPVVVDEIRLYSSSASLPYAKDEVRPKTSNPDLYRTEKGGSTSAVVCLSESSDDSIDLPPLTLNNCAGGTDKFEPCVISNTDNQNSHTKSKFQTAPLTCLKDSASPSDSDDDLELPSLAVRLGTKGIQSSVTSEEPECLNKGKKTKSFHFLSDDDDDDLMIRVPSQSREKKNDGKSSRQKVRVSAEAQKKRKSNEKDRPEKSLAMVIDHALLTTLGTEREGFIAFLDKLDVRYELKELCFPQSITWTLVNDSLQSLIILPKETFFSMVEGDVKRECGQLEESQSISQYVRLVKETYKGTSLTLVPMGTEQFLRKRRGKKPEQAGNAEVGKKRKTKKKSLPQISQIDMETIIIKMQMEEQVNFRLLESPSSISELLMYLTNAAVQAPIKWRKHNIESFSWFIEGDNSNTIKIDRDGKGLLRLWQQQLMQFHQVSKDTAEAIVIRYPSPYSLFKAYRNKKNSDEAKRLLENIEVRRGVGPLSTVRRIGPELSYKIYQFLTSMDGDLSLHR